MKHLALTTALVAVTSSAAFAGGVDRPGPDIGIIFEKGNYIELSASSTNPDLPGTGTAPAIPNSSQSGTAFTKAGLGIKTQINDKLSFSAIFDQPYGADVAYIDGPFNGGNASVKSAVFHGVLRYELGNGMSVHGGISAERLKGTVAAQQGLLDASSKTELAGIAGVAYERPEIAMRVALTYFTGAEHNLSGTHNFQPTTGTVKTPESFNLDFQTGIMADTLLFGSVRHAKWGDSSLVTTQNGTDTTWVSFGDSTSYSLGLGRRISDKLSLALTVGHEPGDSTGASPLTPSGASTSVGLGASYMINNAKISGGVQYTKFDPKTIASAQTFEGNALTVGMSIGTSF